jgi:HEXXH motif-containing protein
MRDESVSRSLSHLSAYPPWPDDFPAALAEAGREALLRPLGLDLADYGTARVRLARPDVRRDLATLVSTPWGGSGAPILVEILPKSLERSFGDGLRFVDQTVAGSASVRDTLQAACGYLGYLPGLEAAVGSLAKILHVLVAHHDDYDVSHSDPGLPFSVFLSVPATPRAVNPLRVVESLIHETMHLQLSLLERLVPLVERSGAGPRFYSPWKGTEREAGGVLHALYVFRVIERFWARVLSARPDATSVRYAASRREQIEHEISAVAGFRRCAALTPAGRELAERLFDGG